MDNMISKEEEKARELKRDKERKEERERQQEREQAIQKGRKQGLEEGRAQEKRKGSGVGTKLIFYLIAIAIIIIVAAFLTLSVSVTNASPGYSLPFTTKYGVSFPEGQTMTIGNTHINVISYQDELISDIDGNRQKLVVGEDRVISERHAVISTLNAIKLMDTNFKINLIYKGNRDNRAHFDMVVLTSEQVPDILVKQLLPPELDAKPI